ncbi:unnamed protein product [Mytilus edulis]|uniref:Reverse transcriptase/retrotransposon-derived protein RNase H-like domain-containing protein n=1 Tax=Mytilus edulis TaxID=6550 RepID=A0A8S3T2E6_MYTED|nr:unnamed protein product [Mytilus edulis]
MKAKIYVDESAVPKYFKARPLPYALKDKVEMELECLEKEVESKVEAIDKAPSPTNVTELKAYLGMLNYYNRFLANLSHLLKPLHVLLQKDTKWSWEKEQEKAFIESKQLLKSASVLVHFDPKKKLILACDASPYGVGAVLLHKMDDGSDKPIAYTSRTLTSAEKNYSVLEKESLAIIFWYQEISSIFVWTPCYNHNRSQAAHRYNRLPYGVASSAGIFQRTLENVVQGIANVLVRVDDILITGKQEKHLNTLSGVESKVEAIDKAPSPTNVTDLKAYLGMLNYYNRFFCEFDSLVKAATCTSTERHKNGVGKEQEKAFAESQKQLLNWASVLVHFDPKEINLSM